MDLSKILADRRPLPVLVGCPDSLDTFVTIKEFRIIRIAEEIDDARNQQHPVIGTLLGFVLRLSSSLNCSKSGKKHLMASVIL